jgi:c-di-GMP-binding flagellar brake protein YcgR
MTESLPTALPDATEPAQPEVKANLGFADMRLNVGVRLQFVPPATLGSEPAIVRLIGYIDQELIFVTAPDASRWNGALLNGDKVELRVFNGITAFRFSTFVERRVMLPVEYLQLSFPRHIAARQIRKSRRVKCQVPVNINGDNTSEDCTVTSNFSSGGAELLTSRPVGNIGDSVTLGFTLPIHGTETKLDLKAIIRALRSGTGAEDGRVSIGVEFVEMSPNETLLLQSFINSHLIEHPQSQL